MGFCLLNSPFLVSRQISLPADYLSNLLIPRVKERTPYRLFMVTQTLLSVALYSSNVRHRISLVIRLE